MVCSGDSFTFGFGVGDEHTWCAQLDQIDSGLTTVNMGQVGYGVDQAYLWYKRDGIRLPHDVHLFAYITNDFRRMLEPSSWGFAKPLLAIRNDSLVVENTPFPPSDRAVKLYWTAVLLRKELRLARLLLEVRDSIFMAHVSSEGAPRVIGLMKDSLTWVTVQHVLDDLVRLNRMKGSTLVLVHLPVLEDYWIRQSDPWREHVKAAASAGEFAFVDLVQELRRLPADSVTQMFIGLHVPGYPSGDRHYTVEGNEWIATQIHRRLLSMPEVAVRLRQAQPITRPSGQKGRNLVH